VVGVAGDVRGAVVFCGFEEAETVKSCPCWSIEGTDEGFACFIFCGGANDDVLEVAVDWPRRTLTVGELSWLHCGRAGHERNHGDEFSNGFCHPAVGIAGDQTDSTK